MSLWKRAGLEPITLVSLYLSALTVAAQAIGGPNPAQLPIFDVVSVNRSNAKSEMRGQDFEPDSILLSNYTLRALVHLAYGVKTDLISGGASWVDSVGFTINAKVSENDIPRTQKMSRDERKAMLQPILAERFGLKIHHQIKLLPVYELVAVKNGTKLKSSSDTNSIGEADKPKTARGAITVGFDNFSGRGVPMTTVVSELEQIVQRTVIDHTGLNDYYDLDLKWSSDVSTASEIAQPDLQSNQQPSAASDREASIFTAVQEQLGLKLNPAKGPVETLVIDQAHLPSEN